MLNLNLNELAVRLRNMAAGERDCHTESGILILRQAADALDAEEKRKARVAAGVTRFAAIFEDWKDIEP